MLPSLRLLLPCLLGGALASSLPAANVKLTLRLEGSDQILPGRFHIKDFNGKPQRAEGLPFWNDHFVCNGQVQFELPVGDYTYEAEHGPEFTAASGRFTATENEVTEVTVRLRRIADLAKEDWWSGETHVHRHLQDAELLMRAEDLHVAQFISWWNRTNPWTNQPPEKMPVAFDGDRFYHPLGGEDERDGGALLFFSLNRPVDITKGARHFPTSVAYAFQAKARGAWLDMEKPFWWDVPMWVANDFGHTIGIANNHQNRAGMLDNEAWGKPRDRSRYPGPRGNGLWTQDIYYHLLNCGLRLPPSAGSASGVLPNPVGYNRVYVHAEPELTYEKWCEGVRAGRSFVSNGPLLRCRANGQYPGQTLAARGPLAIQLEGRLDSRDPIEAVELVRNGRAERVTLPARFVVEESGWFLVRAIAALTNTFRFASTAPWYVEIGGAPMRPRAAAARFFVDWCKERMTALENNSELSPPQRQGVLQPWQRALAFWQDKSLAAGALVTGEVLDATSGQPIAARIYAQDERGQWLFAEPAGAEGSAARYDRQASVNPPAVEKHTAVSAHPFRFELPPGSYTLTVERGKEYLPLTNRFTVNIPPGTKSPEPMHLKLPLRRWVNMAERGWFSGDAHIHREPADLPVTLLAEDLNVGLPIVYWTTSDDVAPSRSSRNFKGDFPASPVLVDATHLYYPRNTEYEIFNTAKKSHTLGALVAVNHRSIFDLTALPLRRVAARAHAEGALLDLEKHNWEWSMAIVPIVKPDLYELANNHLWRTEFTYTNWAVPAPAYMNVGHGRGTEQQWASYGFQNYYALLNCGFRLRPSAGTANGVHPVPLGFGRVYVQMDGPFTYDAWIKGLNAGRSFVTTGPMLLATFNGAPPGHQSQRRPGVSMVRVEGTVLSEQPVKEIELLVNGEVARTVALRSTRGPAGGFVARLDVRVRTEGTSWVAARCWEERAGGRVRFAHTAPVFFDVKDDPPRPRRAEIEFLIERVRSEIARSGPLLPPEALAEYQEALGVYEQLARRAR